MAKNKRDSLLPFSELVDRLTIDQIKEILISRHRQSFSEEISRIIHDINLILKERRIKTTARFMRLLIILSQINLHIWQVKKIMMDDPGHFQAAMKLAHQLNGIRNQIKNLLLREAGFKNSIPEKTNIATDGLKGWQISI